jgi:RimJ/RimL family protein N-acetyltransferase
MFDDRARRYPKTMTLVAKQFLYIAEVSEGLHRLQITVKSDDTRAYRWAKALGFEEEGLMRKFLPDGSDSYMMARIK